MKRKTILNGIITISAATFMVVAGVTAFNKHEEVANADVNKSITTIKLKDQTDEEIVSYYSPLNGKSSSELQGENLLKNLKSIINNNVVYQSYDDVAIAYVVTERNWSVSPQLSNGTYSSDGKTVTGFSHSQEISADPEIHMLYVDYDARNSTKYGDRGDMYSSQRIFDQEHVWSQSHGFSTSDEKCITGAGSDLHHLIAGSQFGNRTLHNNYSYGFVGESNFTNEQKSKYVYSTKNDFGKPLFPHSQDRQDKVFEPQDSDKGDIARALLYMVACYNDLDGSTPTKSSPALKLVNYTMSENDIGFSYDDPMNGYYGSLQDILAWHHMDPVDEYEIHRNNLIFNNYQNNRNPFIDYPQWVDYIWGVSEYNESTKTINYDDQPTGYVDLLKDEIYGYRDPSSADLVSIEITTPQKKTNYRIGDKFDPTGMVITGHYDDLTTKDVTKYCGFTLDTTTIGNNKTVTITCGDISITTTANVLPDPIVTSITLNHTNLSVDMNDGLTLELIPTVNGQYEPSQEAVWSTSNEKVATVADGTVYLRRKGDVIITAAAKDDTSKTATCSIEVADSRPSGSSETVIIGMDDYTDASYTATGNDGTIAKTVIENNDLTLQYKCVNYRSSSDNPYTAYRMYVGGNGYIYSTTVVDGYYPSRVEVFFGSNVSQTAKVKTVFGDEAITEKDTTAEVTPTKGGSYYWTNDNDSLLYWNFSTTSANVQVVSIKVTYTTIGGTGEDVPVSGVSLSPSNLSLEVGQSKTIEATVTPADAANQDLTWESSDTDIATVDGFGLITTISAGNAIITVITDDGGFEATCALTVTEKDTATSQTLTITIDNFLTHTALGSNDTWLAVNGEGIGDITNNATYIGLSNGSGVKLPIHNTQKLRGYITQINIVANSKMETSKDLNIYYSEDMFEFSGNTPSGIEPNTQSLVYGSDITVSLNKDDHFRYFAIKPMGTSIYIDSISITYDASEYLASEWAKGFTNSMDHVCDSVTGNTNLTNLTNAWSEQELAYTPLDSTVKALLNGSVGIYDSEYRANVEAMISSYTFIAGKYTTLNRFINGVTVNSVIKPTTVLDNKNYVVITLAITISSLSLVSLLFFLRQRKKKEI